MLGPAPHRGTSAGNEDGTERERDRASIHGRTWTSDASASDDDRTEKICALDSGRADRCWAAPLTRPQWPGPTDLSGYGRYELVQSLRDFAFVRKEHERIGAWEIDDLHPGWNRSEESFAVAQMPQ